MNDPGAQAGSTDAGRAAASEPARTDEDAIGGAPAGDALAAGGTTEFEPAAEVSQAERADPWAHRRGEPRVFAMCWLIYVTLTVTGSVRWVVQSTSEISPLSYGPSARIMLIVLATGALVLWPMVRLSQSAPARARLSSAILADMLIILVPSWLVIVPLRFIAGWPMDVVAAIAAIFGAWTYLTGGVLALALSRVDPNRPAAHRWLWMLGALACVGAGMLVHAAFRAREMIHDASTPAWMSFLSPFSAIPMLTGRGLWGPQAPVETSQWGVLVATLAIGLGLWSVAGVWSMKGDPSVPNDGGPDDRSTDPIGIADQSPDPE